MDKLDFEVDRASYLAVLRQLKGISKEMNVEMRQEAIHIAETIIKPAVQGAILRQASNYGPKLAQSVRATRDRIPKVRIGDNKKKSPSAFSGGAATNMIRYGTIQGPYTYASGSGNRSDNVATWAAGVTPGWTETASNAYMEPAFRAWENAVESVIVKWNAKGL